MKKIIITFLFMISLSLAHAQPQFNLPEERYFLKGTVSLDNLEKFTATNIKIQSDSISFNSLGTNRAHHLGEINYLKLQKGTKAKNGFLIGAGSMLFISLLSIAEVESDPNRQLVSNAGTIVLGFTAGGGLLGALIGSTIPNYQTHYVNLN